MECDIHATLDGAPCDEQLQGAVQARVAHLAAGLALQACRVVIDTRHKPQAGGRYVFALLEVQPAGAAQFLPSSHAIEDSAEAALDTVFAIAAAALRHWREAALDQPRSSAIAAHIVALAADGSSGTLQAEDGRTLAFIAANDEVEHVREMRVGDRAWLTPHPSSDRPFLLVCGRRGRQMTVRLERVG